MSQEKNSLKPHMVEYLQGKGITNIDDLWSYAKTFASTNGYQIGGSYASFGKDISVSLLKNDTRETFKITLEEVKQKK